MSLDRLFSGHQIIRSATDDVPSLWSHLISLPRQLALSWITECLGIAKSSSMAIAINAASDFGVVAPRRMRDRKVTRMWEMAVLYAPSRAMLFGCPDLDLLPSTFDLPSEYLQIVAKLGSLRFDQYSGDLMWPAGIQQIAHEIIHSLANTSSTSEVTPFFDHHTGDYDCWIKGEFETIFTYDHEGSKFHKYCDGGFVGWLQRRFEDSLDL